MEQEKIDESGRKTKGACAYSKLQHRRVEVLFA